jgi:2-oxoglutarate/2-oxoacid ferredoxin oxidoreductase subunit alpha
MQARSHKDSQVRNDFVIRIGGDTAIGGVISTGENFTTAAARLGFQVFTFRSYPAEIKGGHAWFQVRISNRPVLSTGDGVDILIAFDEEAYERHCGELRESSVIIYDSDLVQVDDGRFIRYGVPFQRIARQELNFARGTNVLVLGLMAGLFGLPLDSLQDLVRLRYKRRVELVEKNLEALAYGFDYTNKIRKEDKYYLGTSDHVSRLVMSGNDAIVAGALHAGCRFFAGYPITPASDILESMARELPRLGGICLQAEDEMAAIASCIGASYGGAKAMTATSGPGFSLMIELLGLASMTELPLVLVDAQRSGPSTGMPTKLEQADLFQALYGGHGDFPRIVLAPASVEDCLYRAVHAFNLAEKYQMPVIVLSDQSLSHRTQTIDMPNLSRLPIVNRLQPSDGAREEYARYAFSDTGVSPVALPGVHIHTYVAPGLEHDERGHPNQSPQVHEAMTEKRFLKFSSAAADTDSPDWAPRYGDPKAQVGVIGWGASEGAIREAVERAVAKGYKVASLHPRILNPLPQARIREFAASVKRVLVPEVNYQGQFAHHLAASLGISPVRFNKIGGLPFTSAEILGKIEEVASHV